MEVWEKKAYHYEKPIPEHKEDKSYKPVDPVKSMRWKSLIANGLCAGMQSLCVVDKCDVMCAYGRRYLAEKEQHAG